MGTGMRKKTKLTMGVMLALALSVILTIGIIPTALADEMPAQDTATTPAEGTAGPDESVVPADEASAPDTSTASAEEIAPPDDLTTLSLAAQTESVIEESQSLTPQAASIEIYFDGVAVESPYLFPAILAGSTDCKSVTVTLKNTGGIESGELAIYGVAADDCVTAYSGDTVINTLSSIPADGEVSFTLKQNSSVFSGYDLTTMSIMHEDYLYADIACGMYVLDKLPLPTDLQWDATNAWWNQRGAQTSGTIFQLFKDGTADANKVGSEVLLSPLSRSYDCASLMAQYGKGTYYYKVKTLGEITEYTADSDWAVSAGCSYASNIEATQSSLSFAGEGGWWPNNLGLTNTGLMASGTTTLSIQGPDAEVFTLDRTTVGSLAAGGHTSVTVGVRDGTGVGTYSAELIISSEGQDSFSVPLTATINRLFTGTSELEFEVPRDYDPDDETASLYVYSNLSVTSGVVTASISGQDAGCFSVTPISLSGIAAGGNGLFVVHPVAGCTLGQYHATLSLYEHGILFAEISLSLEVQDWFLPGAPTNLQWDSSGNHILSWDAVEGVDGYAIYLCRNGEYQWQAFVRPDTCYYDCSPTMSTYGPGSYTMDVTAVKRGHEGDDALSPAYGYQVYSVAFDANGGSGTIAPMDFVFGNAQNLSTNTFTKTGYHFVGWATTADGAVAYADEQSVSDLTTQEDSTVTLYAVWEQDNVPTPSGGPTDDSLSATPASTDTTSTVTRSTTSIPSTGDTTSLLIPGILLLLAVALLVIFLYRRNRMRR